MDVRGALTALSALAVLGGLPVGPARADSAADFYTNKTVTVVVPASMGASIGLYGQLVARHIGKHIPGQPEVITQSMPGASGAKAAAWVFNAAPKDGSIIAEVLSTSLVAPRLRGAKFDPAKFHWLGSVSQRPSVVTVWHTAPATTLDALKTTQVVLGTSALASSGGIIPTLMNHMLGTKFKVVAGYPGGGEMNEALEKGEIQGRWNFWTGWTSVKADWLKAGKLVHLVQVGPRIKALPDVPRFRDLVSKPEYKQMIDFMSLTELVGLGFWVHPDVPQDRYAALKKAFEDTVADPEFIADATKRRAPVEPVSGEELTQIVTETMKIDQPTLDELKQIVGFK